jgi:hypothetical protein
MTLHLLKTALGIKDLGGLRRRQNRWARQHDGAPVRVSATRRRPKRAEELAGGSVYWILRGSIRARQPIRAFIHSSDEDGRYLGLLLLEPDLIETRPVEHKGFQGWRYLDPADAPPDHGEDEPPAEMLAELQALGLL